MPRPSAPLRLRRELFGFVLATGLVLLILLLAGRGGEDVATPGAEPAPRLETPASPDVAP